MIKALDKYYDHNKLLDIYQYLNIDEPQVNFTSRGKDDIMDGIGSIFKYDPAKETDWNKLHPLFKNTYLEEVYDDLAKDWTLGRGRFMKMDSRNRALSFHYDDCHRLHIPIITNPESWFILEDKTIHSMPELGRLYDLDGTRNHSALNLSWKNLPRVHIVISVFPKDYSL